MKIDATGFVGAQAGSVASANAVLLKSLLARRHAIRFFTKPSFVDPRQIDLDEQAKQCLSVFDCTNHIGDAARRLTASIPVCNRLTGWFDVATYHRSLVARMNVCNHQDPSSLSLWLGDCARGRVSGVPSIGFLQGPPGTDAQSVAQHESLITRLAGRSFYLRLKMYALWRMGPGYPDLSHSDQIIVGSEWSRSHLVTQNKCAANRIHVLPYPIDLNEFKPSTQRRQAAGPLKVLWLGRFVPRKRLELFLDGLKLAIQNGCDVHAIVIGSSGFVPNYERLINEFPFTERIEHKPSIARSDVPDLMAAVDVLAQPSDAENFGSSVAEALACGLPVIVGATNGTGDYMCSRSIRLADDEAHTMAAAIATLADAKSRGDLVDSAPSRSVAEKFFETEAITDRLELVFGQAVAAYGESKC